MFLPQPNPATVHSGARSIQPKFRPVRPGKVVHLKKVDQFFRNFSGWTELIRWFERLALNAPPVYPAEELKGLATKRNGVSNFLWEVTAFEVG